MKRRNHVQHQHGRKWQTKKESMQMRGKERLFLISGFFGFQFGGNGISQPLDPGGYFFFGELFGGVKDHIARGVIDLYILHALFFQVFMDIDRAGIAIHSVHFPLYFFHVFSFGSLVPFVAIIVAKLRFEFGPANLQGSYLLHKVANPKYICGMEMVFHLSEIEKAARELVREAGTAPVVALYGEMGAGKTTLVHAVCEIWGVVDIVSSPTFSIINEYRGKPGRIFHIDLYRLKDEGEAIQAGVEDCILSGDICLVEWPARCPELFPPGHLAVTLEVVDAETRRMRIDRK